MHTDSDTTESPATFLEELGKSLNSTDVTDAELAKIVSQHILTAFPDENSVEKAMTAITKLAATRATFPKEYSDG